MAKHDSPWFTQEVDRQETSQQQDQAYNQQAHISQQTKSTSQQTKSQQSKPTTQGTQAQPFGLWDLVSSGEEIDGARQSQIQPLQPQGSGFESLFGGEDTGWTSSQPGTRHQSEEPAQAEQAAGQDLSPQSEQAGWSLGQTPFWLEQQDSRFQAVNPQANPQGYPQQQWSDASPYHKQQWSAELQNNQQYQPYPQSNQTYPQNQSWANASSQDWGQNQSWAQPQLQTPDQSPNQTLNQSPNQNPQVAAENQLDSSATPQTAAQVTPEADLQEDKSADNSADKSADKSAETNKFYLVPVLSLTKAEEQALLAAAKAPVLRYRNDVDAYQLLKKVPTFRGLPQPGATKAQTDYLVTWANLSTDEYAHLTKSLTPTSLTSSEVTALLASAAADAPVALASPAETADSSSPKTQTPETPQTSQATQTASNSACRVDLAKLPPVDQLVENPQVQANAQAAQSEQEHKPVEAHKPAEANPTTPASVEQEEQETAQVAAEITVPATQMAPAADSAKTAGNQEKGHVVASASNLTGSQTLEAHAHAQTTPESRVIAPDEHPIYVHGPELPTYQEGKHYPSQMLEPSDAKLAAIRARKPQYREPTPEQLQEFVEHSNFHRITGLETTTTANKPLTEDTNTARDSALALESINKLLANLDQEQVKADLEAKTRDLKVGLAALQAEKTKSQTLLFNINNYQQPQVLFSDESFASATPMMKQWLEIKKDNPEYVLFFRMGDFYEFFFEDAVIASKTVDISITTRQEHMGYPIPMAGVPYHSYQGYAEKMVKAGIPIAIVEQVSDPKAKGLTERAVIRVCTPGTLSDSGFLPERESRPLVAICSNLAHYAIALCDVSTGYVEVSVVDNHNDLVSRLEQVNPAEILCSDERLLTNNLRKNTFCRTLEPEYFAEGRARAQVRSIYDKEELAKLERYAQATNAVGALLAYVVETQKVTPSHLQPIQFVQDGELCFIDAATVTNLEIYRSLGGQKATSLVNALDNCCTLMGGRLLRSWIRQPTRNLGVLQKRLDTVEELLNNNQARLAIRDLLSQVGDIERIIGRISLGNASPKDLGDLRNNLVIIPDLNNTIARYELTSISFLEPLEPLKVLLAGALQDQQPLTLNNGGVIRAGYNQLLDEYRSTKDNIEQLLRDIERRERANTGIDALSVKMMQTTSDIFIQIPPAAFENAVIPAHYIMRQSLKTAKRFTTAELQDLQHKFINSETAILDLERKLFDELVQTIRKVLPAVQSVAKAISQLDLLGNFAQLAYDYDYTRPEFNQEHVLKIDQGRHPVIEKLVSPFISNDTDLYASQSLAIITGPNMGGKSTYMRQNAIIALMALMGAFVPAKYANIPLFDKILTRIGASDDISTGKSTFMVEMSEMAYILKNATADSLLLIDEVGRGTSTFDGMSLAWACAQWIAQQTNALTLFSTHYFELVELANQLDNVINLYVNAIDHDGEISFLHEIKSGYATSSYGLAVAKLAGVPAEVLAIAQSQLNALTTAANAQAEQAALTQKDDADKQAAQTGQTLEPVDQPAQARTSQQVAASVPASRPTSFTCGHQLQVQTPVVVPASVSPQQEQVLELLETIDVEELTARRALDLMFELKDMLKKK